MTAYNYFTNNSFCCTELKIQYDNLRRSQLEEEDEGASLRHGGHIQSHTHTINRTPYSSSLHQLQSEPLSALVPDCEIENDIYCPVINLHPELTTLEDDNPSHDMSHDYYPSQTWNPEQHYITTGHDDGWMSHDSNNIPWATVSRQTKIGREGIPLQSHWGEKKNE